MRQQKYSALILFSALVITNFANAAPKKTKPAEAPKAKFSKVEKKPKKAGVRLIPSEYNSYFQARSVLAKPGADLAAIESAEHSLLLAKMSNEAKTLDKDQEELFYALEIRRAEKFAQKKEFAHATESFQRALNGLGAYKWIYYWSETSSKNLASVCNRNKKQKDEACLTLAKRVADAFPKVALETKALRDLPSIESAGVSSEIGSDRLSQTYSEKIEKDEKAFEEILAYFLNGSHSDLLKTAKAFINDYPKSILRFRAQFLMAETYFKKGDSKEAQPLYQAIIDQTPISYYALIASERLNKPLREMVKNDFVKQIDVSQPDWQSFNLNLNEKSTIERALALRSKKHYEEVGIELDSLNRARAYSTEFLLYLMQLATATNQNLTAFRTGNELIGRRYDGFLRDEMLNMIFPDRFNKEIEEQSVMNHVDPLLILSLMKQESGFKAPILSSSGALGLMQLMPFTAIDVKKDLYLSTLKEPEVNISVGTKYLSGLMDKYSNNAVYALAAYNAGPHRVAKWRKDAKPDWTMIEFIEAIPYKETRDYVMSILRNRYWYQYRRKLPLKSVFEAWTSVPSASSTSM